MWNTVLTEWPSTTQNHCCAALELGRLSPKHGRREQWNQKDLLRLDAHTLPLWQHESITQQQRCKQSSVWNTLDKDRRTPSTECQGKWVPPFPNMSWKLYQKGIKRLWNIYKYINFLSITYFPWALCVKCKLTWKFIQKVADLVTLQRRTTAPLWRKQGQSLWR